MARINLLDVRLAALVVIDVQEKMLSAITSSAPEQIIDRIRRLVEVARLLDLPILFTEQYPEGLGATDRRVRDVLPTGLEPLVKSTCSCWRDAAFRTALQRTEKEHIVLAGLEAHVCVQQTALDLLRVDYVPFLAVDAIGSRCASDMDVALERMRRAGAEVSTVEALAFELIERCDHPRFKHFLRIIK